MRAAAFASAALLAIAISGCSSAGSGIEDAVAQGIAAVETASLAVEQELADRTFSTVTVTALGDARRELVDATTTVSETDATNDADATLRTEALSALALGVDAVNDARDAMAGLGSLDAAELLLEEASAALEAVETQSGTSATADRGGR
ncbi:MAG TPA: hypothetical protein VFE99_06490, partial [Agromyces sp.]|nr:hypothetical protein [Agromyces sp.]